MAVLKTKVYKAPHRDYNTATVITTTSTTPTTAQLWERVMKVVVMVMAVNQSLWSKEAKKKKTNIKRLGKRRDTY